MQKIKSRIIRIIIIAAFIMIILLFAFGIMPNASFVFARDNLVEISTPEELIAFSDYVNAGNYTDNMIYKLTQDIDLSQTDFGEEGFSPIGAWKYFREVQFSGIFDGQGYAVRGLWINRPDEDYIGLFGISDGTIMNLTVESDVSKGGIVGGNCVGGIVASTYGKVENCAFFGKVSGKEAIGGIVGEIAQNEIIGSVNCGEVTGSLRNSGGIVGHAGGSWRGISKITACLNAGRVTGPEFSGGIAGEAFFTQITSCLNIGKVDDGNGSGGIVGYIMSSSSSAVDSYFDTVSTSGQIFWDGDENIDDVEIIDGEYGTGLATSMLISRSFLNEINKDAAYFALPAHTDFHYYPVPANFERNAAVVSFAASAIPVYNGMPVVSSKKLVYGEKLNTITFNANLEGVFSWLQPDLVLSEGTHIVYASFIPFGDKFGERYDVEILITVTKPLDLTWLWILIACLAGVTLIMLAAKKFRIISRIKQKFEPKTVVVEKIVEKEIVTEKEVIIEKAAPALKVNLPEAYNINYKLKRVYLNGEDTLLTPKEFALFEFLLNNENLLFTAEDLFAVIWETAVKNDARTIRVYIANIRKKLQLGLDYGIDIETKERKFYTLVRTL